MIAQIYYVCARRMCQLEIHIIIKQHIIIMVQKSAVMLLTLYK